MKRYRLVLVTPVIFLSGGLDFLKNVYTLMYGIEWGDRTRIISARPAVPTEERAYYEWRKNFVI
jgi:uncharacterized DUF497 family protein